MSSDVATGTPVERLRWALGESLVIAGVLLVWVGVALSLTLVATLLRVVLARLPGHALSPVAHLLGRIEFLWPGFVTAATATVALYVVVRAGTLLIDHYRATGR